MKDALLWAQLALWLMGIRVLWGTFRLQRAVFRWLEANPVIYHDVRTGWVPKRRRRPRFLRRI